MLLLTTDLIWDSKIDCSLVKRMLLLELLFLEKIEEMRVRQTELKRKSIGKSRIP